jgi:arylsulfatase A-like enzyme
LQSFAEEGTVFRQCFCANPTCSPSRAALLTGEYAHSCGMYGLAHRGFKMPDYSKHIVHTLRTAGYKSYLLGIQHIIAGEEKDKIGYDEILDVPAANAEHLGPAACEFLNRKHESPFFLSVGFFETHRKFPEYEPEDDPRWLKPPEFLPDTPETRRDMADFNTMAHHYDSGIGKILDCLDKNGLSENTLVIITTDHGIAFPRAKCNLQDSGIGVLLMMRGPGGFEGGKVIDSLVSHVDLFPTICDVAGIEKPGRLQGKSLMPLIKGEAKAVRDEVFAEVNFHAAYEPLRCVRTERFKYIRRLLKRGKAVMPNCDNGYSKTLWVDNGWPDKGLVQEELYDLIFDPNEANNLINEPEMKSIANDLRRRLEKWMLETNDPALHGMPGAHCPENCVANDQNELEPNAAGATRLTREFRERNEIP